MSAWLIKSGIRGDRTKTGFYWLDSTSNREHMCSKSFEQMSIILIRI